MGVPPDIVYGNDCLACWAAGQTPKHLYMSLTGIVSGPTWADWMDPPPNGVWKLTQTVPCHWGFFFSFMHFEYIASPAPGLIEVHHAATSSPFLSGPLPACANFAISTVTPPPAASFYYGKAQISEIP